MKRVILVAAIAAMCFTTACQQSQSESTASVAVSTEAVVSSDVAYFNIDSLVNKFDMYLDMSTAYQAKAQSAEVEMTSKARSLESDIASYQEKVQKGLVTRAQAAELEQQITTKQQAFVTYRDNIVAELAEQEQVLLNNIQHSITSYLSEFNADYRYGMIISTTVSGPVYNANPALDITSEILKGLNDKYAKEKK